uniref:C2H2-type domain-containing protein n=1 Tax=Polytomella parva TaxID=51329 RepID=A0A6U0V2M0_9CHLO|mmetsp:Transcript_19364/g.34957  ORF Transcript_19364/g.34957 Transcript_19364/m.34957 type:complete len:900 (+) Transcript_19364:191-2890(+)|eukprot:CAMPEP_0175053234 /NCGR_PEP_ID=MMETSP0052_2-20121109/8809_1 /TAXON_ID=51329 ORGANISM="Polytomella parva, Strain SAG 63-3" /NCGR_SAMPLE_ID=MMETSP0052_2 /ASSEMBLY_ACC=CAM_ASM_000194 /LENGTH=899 /DNA_ID=CAMNT_0016317741 /DNA_START=109 /DNA_END=2808 /DNA_ORIENTATION=-
MRGRNYKCVDCDETFQNGAQLKAHNREVHSDNFADEDNNEQGSYVSTYAPQNQRYRSYNNNDNMIPQSGSYGHFGSRPNYNNDSSSNSNYKADRYDNNTSGFERRYTEGRNDNKNINNNRYDSTSYSNNTTSYQNSNADSFNKYSSDNYGYSNNDNSGSYFSASYRGDKYGKSYNRNGEGETSSWYNQGAHPGSRMSYQATGDPILDEKHRTNNASRNDTSYGTYHRESPSSLRNADYYANYNDTHHGYGAKPRNRGGYNNNATSSASYYKDTSYEQPAEGYSNSYEAQPNSYAPQQRRRNRNGGRRNNNDFNSQQDHQYSTVNPPVFEMTQQEAETKFVGTNPRRRNNNKNRARRNPPPHNVARTDLAVVVDGPVVESTISRTETNPTADTPEKKRGYYNRKRRGFRNPGETLLEKNEDHQLASMTAPPEEATTLGAVEESASAVLAPAAEGEVPASGNGNRRSGRGKKWSGNHGRGQRVSEVKQNAVEKDEEHKDIAVGVSDSNKATTVVANPAIESHKRSDHRRAQTGGSAIAPKNAAPSVRDSPTIPPTPAPEESVAAANAAASNAITPVAINTGNRSSVKPSGSNKRPRKNERRHRKNNKDKATATAPESGSTSVLTSANTKNNAPSSSRRKPASWNNRPRRGGNEPRDATEEESSKRNQHKESKRRSPRPPHVKVVFSYDEFEQETPAIVEGGEQEGVSITTTPPSPRVRVRLVVPKGRERREPAVKHKEEGSAASLAPAVTLDESATRFSSGTKDRMTRRNDPLFLAIALVPSDAEEITSNTKWSTSWRNYTNRRLQQAIKTGKEVEAPVVHLFSRLSQKMLERDAEGHLVVTPFNDVMKLNKKRRKREGENRWRRNSRKEKEEGEKGEKKICEEVVATSTEEESPAPAAEA